MKFNIETNTPSNLKDYWQTPKYLYEYLNKRFNFICDVAANWDNSLHENYLTEEYDSLKNGWGNIGKGYVFCNPPYSGVNRKLGKTTSLDDWIIQASKSSGNGVGTVMLIPADLAVSRSENIIGTANEIIFFIGKRISFIDSRTEQPEHGNNHGSMCVVWYDKPSHEALKTTYVNLKDIQNAK